MADVKTQRLVLSFIEFLRGAIDDGTVKDDDREGLEVASECSVGPTVRVISPIAQSNALAKLSTSTRPMRHRHHD